MSATGSVYLLGPPLGGKSTIGKILAEALGLAFADLDLELEQTCSKTIPQIFKDHGEAFFRDKETQILQDSALGPRRILSTGGGVVEREENRQFLKNQTSVYLNNSLEDLLARGRRIKSGGKDLGRPLLAGEDWEQRLSALYQRRLPLYQEAARWTVSCEGTPTEVVERVRAALRQGGA